VLRQVSVGLEQSIAFDQFNSAIGFIDLVLSKRLNHFEILIIVTLIGGNLMLIKQFNLL